MSPEQLQVLLGAARTFAARHTGAAPEITYTHWNAAARLRSTGRRALVRTGDDHDLPGGGEAVLIAVARHTLTRQDTAMPPEPRSLADTSDDTLTALITALASYLDHRTTARLHHTRGLRTWSAEQQADADRSLTEATRLLATSTSSDAVLKAAAGSTSPPPWSPGAVAAHRQAAARLRARAARPQHRPVWRVHEDDRHRTHPGQETPSFSRNPSRSEAATQLVEQQRR
ncbi:hypothetical protein Pen01_78430 [Phytomonospora endophytica]|nr:hypothetical protein Pen01_78430 [Phytomonospora endophytica]